MRPTAPLPRSCPTCPWCAAPTDPLQRLQAHAAKRPTHRVLMLAESDGRRESLLDFLRASS